MEVVSPMASGRRVRLVKVTWRELAAVLQVLLGVAKKLTNHRVRWFTDNQNVARILMVGSKKRIYMR